MDTTAPDAAARETAIKKRDLPLADK